MSDAKEDLNTTDVELHNPDRKVVKRESKHLPQLDAGR